MEDITNLAPVHGVAGSTNVIPHVALQPETGEQEVTCVIMTPPDVINAAHQMPPAAPSFTPNMTMVVQCPTCTDSLLPKPQSEDISTQTLPTECPPYVDICSPLHAGQSTPSGVGTPQLLVRSPLHQLGTPQLSPVRTPLLDRSPALTPGQCTPLLEHKTDTLSLGLPPVVICGGLPGSGFPSVCMNSDKSDTNSAILPICRICHMPGEDEEEMLISPCRCAGTLQFIHNTCLQKWLEISSKKSRKPPKCELCHYQYHRHKKFKFHHWRFPRVSRQDKILHLIFIVNLVIMISCAIATVMCFLSDKGQITKFPRNKVDLTTEEIITLSCGVLFFVSFFIAMSVQIKAKHTIYQLFVKFIMQNMEWEIDEYDKTKDTLFKTKESKPAFV